MVAANSVEVRLESARVIPRIIPSSASVNGRPQNARPSPIVTGIASDLLHAGSHAYVTGIFRESPENSSPRTSRMYKLQQQLLSQLLFRLRPLLCGADRRHGFHVGGGIYLNLHQWLV